MNSTEFVTKFKSLKARITALMADDNPDPYECQRTSKEAWEHGMLSMSTDLMRHAEACAERRKREPEPPPDQEPSVSELAIIKRCMFSAAEVVRTRSVREVNADINASVLDALEQLPPEQRELIEREQQHLMDCIHGLGEIGALELLASVSEYVRKE